MFFVDCFECSNVSLLCCRFHVNDVDNEVIARNIVLLEIVSSINLDNLSDIEYLWDVWYNMTLMQGHYVRLKMTLERLLDGSSSSLWKFGDRQTKKQVTATWKSWLETEPLDRETIEKSRLEYLEYYSMLRCGESLSNTRSMPVEPFLKTTSMTASVDNLVAHLNEWNEVVKAGIARDFMSNNNNDDDATSEEIINPTMMRPGSSKWHVHYGINPIAAYLPFDR